MTYWDPQRYSPEYTEWRKAVFVRDGKKCTESGEKGSLHAHHIKHYAAFPELRLEVSNGITLCRNCHSEKHPERRDAILFYGRSNRRVLST